MALVLADRVRDTTTTTSTGTITLSGTAPTGFQNFSVIGNGNTTYYTIAGQGTSEWEVGIGTYSSSGTTLARTTVLSSSNSGSLVNFSAGTKDVFVTYPSERSVNISSAALTSGRVPYATTDGLLVDAANLTFNGTTLTANTIGAFTLSGTVAGGGNQLNNVIIGTLTPLAGNFTTVSGTTSVTTPSVTNAGTLALSATSTNVITASTNGSERMRVDSSGNIDIGTTSNAIYDQTGAARPLVVQKSDTSTTVGGSLAAIAIVNGDTTTSNTAQLNFAAITGASANQYSSAWISCIFGARTNTQYPTGQLVFATSTTLNSAPSEKLRIDNSGNLLIGTSTSPAGSKELVLGGDYIEAVVAIGTVTSSNTISLANGTLQTATLTASTACTFTMPTAIAGKSFTLLLKQAAATGNGTATFTSVKWGTAGAPTITATAGKMDILTFVSDGTNWYGSIAQGYTP